MLKKELGKAKAEMEKKMAKIAKEMRTMLGGMGALALNELDASLDKSIKDMDEKEAANILKGFDKNKDGKVDKKEFVDNIQNVLHSSSQPKKCTKWKAAMVSVRCSDDVVQDDFGSVKTDYMF